MTSQYPAGSIRVKGISHDVLVSDGGEWIAYVNGDPVRAASKDALAKAINAQTRKATAKVSVPFTQLLTSPPSAIRGTATGLHGKSGNVLVRWQNGDTAQFSRWETSGVVNVNPVSDEEAAWWIARKKEYLKIARELHDFEATHKIDLRAAVADALQKAVSGQEEDS